MLLAIILLIVSLSCFSAMNIVIKTAVAQGVRSPILTYLFFTMAGTIMLIIAAFRGELADINWAVVGLGLAGGIGGATAVNCFAQALKIGHYGFTSSSVALSAFIPALFAVIFYGAPFGWTEICGLVLISIALVLIAIATSANAAQGSKHIDYRRWAILMILTLILNSTVGIVQTVFDHNHMPGMFLFLASIYFCGTIIFTPMIYKDLRIVTHRATLKWGVFGAICTTGGMISCQLALHTLSPVVVFPVVLVAPVFVGLVISRLLFREKISFRGYLGIAMALIGIVLLSGVVTSILRG